MRLNNYQPHLHRFSILTSAATWMLICAGGLVTGTESGLSVPDWPLSYGSLFPPMVGGIRFEHSHRMIAGVVLILTLAQAIWLWRKDSRGWVRRMGFFAFGLVILQAIFGGLTVIYMLPPPVSILHALMAQTFFALTVLMAYATSAPWFKSEAYSPAANLPAKSPPPSWIFHSLLCLVAAWAQILLGAMRRHGVLAGIHAHVIGAAVLTLFVLSLFYRISNAGRENKRLWLLVFFMNILIFLELLLGIASWQMRAIDASVTGHALSTIAITTAHVAGGALVLASSVVILSYSIRLNRQNR